MGYIQEMSVRAARSLCLILFLTFIGTVASAQVASQPRVDEAAIKLTFVAADQMVLEVPVTGASVEQVAALSASLLDVDDTVVLQASGACSAVAGKLLCRATLPAVDAPTARALADNLPFLRVRYGVAGRDTQLQGILSLNHIAPQLVEIHVAGPFFIRPGEKYVARLRAVHPLTGKPQAHVPLVAVLRAHYRGDEEEYVDYSEDGDRDAKAEEFSSSNLMTDANGFATVRFTAPDPGDLVAVYLDVQSKVGGFPRSLMQVFHVANRGQMQLTTDKPIYQPGQVIHTRALVLDRSGHARANEKVTLKVEDPNSTSMFRAEAVTSKFGVASIDWPIPARIFLGDYDLKAEGEHDEKSVAQVRISRYDLPTFTVEPKSDRTFYLPGQDAAITVRAKYLFGRPVLHGHARVVRDPERTWNFLKQQYESGEEVAVEGDLNAQGEFVAHIDLQKDAEPFHEEGRYVRDYDDVKFAVYVTDASTGRTEQRRLDLRIAAEPLQVYPLGESSVLPNKSRRMYVGVTRADGTAVESDIEIGLLPREPETQKQRDEWIAAGRVLRRAHTNALGLLRVDLSSEEELTKLLPVSSEAERSSIPVLYFVARSKAGETGRRTETLSATESAIRLRADKPLYQQGDEIQVELESPEPSLPVTVQFLRQANGRPVLLESQNVSLMRGRASVRIASDKRFRGIVLVTATALRPTPGEVQGESGSTVRIAVAGGAILFPEDTSLKVGIQMSKTEYRPGEEATARLKVDGPNDPDDESGASVPSDLGVAVVDQAVAERNRTDHEFGEGWSAPFFFRRYSVSSGRAGGWTLDQFEQLEPGKPIPKGADLAAEMLLTLEAEQAKGQVKKGSDARDSNYANIFAKELKSQLSPLRSSLRIYLSDHPDLPDDEKERAALTADWGIDLLDLRDPWGMPYRLKAKRSSHGQAELFVLSDGPDKRPDTSDDFTQSVASWNWFSRRQEELRRVVETYHAQTGGFLRNMTELRKAMSDAGQQIDSWRDPWGQPFQIRFTIQLDRFVIWVRSSGDPSEGHADEICCMVGNVSIDYFQDRRARIQSALQARAEGIDFPHDEAQFEEALRRANLPPDTLIDPWGHKLYALFSRQNIFTDSAWTESHVGEGGSRQNRTALTPVTELVETLVLLSRGPDGVPSADDVTLMRISHVLSQQSAAEATAMQPGVAITGMSGTGMLQGIISDPTGAVIPGADIVISSSRDGNEYDSIKSDVDGGYVLAGIPAGRYKLRVHSPGFMDLVYDEVTVFPGAVATLNAVLRVGSVDQTVAVAASTVSLQTDASLAATAVTVKTELGPSMSGRQVALSTPRLREYFPETMLWRPEVVTAKDGSATIHFPVADSMTTWTIAASASTEKGNLGGATAQFRSFQPFFALFDPPSVLTVGDSVSLPVTLHNYLNHAVQVKSSIAPAPWFRLNSAAEIANEVPSQETSSPVFRFTAFKAGENKQEFVARGAEVGDRVAHPVQVHPDGVEIAATASGIASAGDTDLSVTLPADVLADGSDVTLRLYPNLSAHMQEALTAMARYPDGCAEQIMSIAWPSLLLQRYASALPKADEAIQQKTHRQLEEAYQNLLGNQLASGGFAYWRQSSSADEALTAYAIQFLTQAKSLIEVDDQVIRRAVTYLTVMQERDGRWITRRWDGTPQPQNRSGNAMLTLSIAAMIADTPQAKPLVIKALTATEGFTEEFDEPYTVANYALAALRVKDEARSRVALTRLRFMAQSENGGTYWQLETNTVFFGSGRAGRVETTAMVLQALLAGGANPADDLVARGFVFLDREQDRYGLWYSTQATARVLDAMASVALSNSAAVVSNEPSTVKVLVDGKEVRAVDLPPAAKASGPVEVPLGAFAASGQHRVTLRVPPGSANMMAHLTTVFYRPWSTVTSKDVVINKERLRMALKYDSTSIAPGTAVEAAAHVERIGFEGYGMMLAEIGLPPGAEVDRSSLESAMAESDYQINHYDVLPDKVVLYLWPHAGGMDVKFRFKLRYAVDALSAPSSVYDYYNPDARAEVAPVRFTTH